VAKNHLNLALLEKQKLCMQCSLPVIADYSSSTSEEFFYHKTLKVLPNIRYKRD
jgi:hypothetical protein